MRIDAAADPILRLERASGDPESFRQMIRRAVGEAPARIEAEAEVEAARAARGQARAALFPYIDVGTTSFRTIARNFSGDLQTIVEQARGRGRSDITLNAQQTVYDFGATSDRIGAANARLVAAAANGDDVSDGVALRAIGAWYDVYVFRALVVLAEALGEDQAALRRAVEERVAGGVSAAGDVARVDSYIASADTRLAGYRRRQADAEARYAALLRVPAPAVLSRAPLLGEAPGDRQALRDAAVQRPLVLVAEAQAEAARQDAQAARADTRPQLTAGIQSGRYGYLEGLPDYDVRGVVTLRKRFFGGVDARADQVRAQAGAAAARAARTREEAIRDAEIAASDVAALDRQIAALSASYIAARRSRDVLLERFRVERGTLIDVLAAEDTFFLAAASWIQTLGERDAARYVLLSRTGRLLPALDILPTQGRKR